MAIPKKLDPFYSSRVDLSSLYQGDILEANPLGLKQEREIYSPDFWMIITKSCDLQKNEDGSLRGASLNLIPLFSLKLINLFLKRGFEKSISDIKSKIILIGVHNLYKVFLKYENKNNLDKLIQGKLSKFMYLPPDGKILTEPMFIDFDLIQILDATRKEDIETYLSTKKLQLNSPYREKIAQKFALHFSSIGIDDDEIRTKQYFNELKSKF